MSPTPRKKNIDTLDSNLIDKALYRIRHQQQGVIAQLVEHCNGIAGVTGSSPVSSIEVKYSPASVRRC